MAEHDGIARAPKKFGKLGKLGKLGRRDARRRLAEDATKEVKEIFNVDYYTKHVDYIYSKSL